MPKKQTVKKDSPLGRVLAQRTGNWMLSRIDEHLEENNEYRHDPGWFHPSAVSSPCDAFLAFTYMGTLGKGTVKARSRRIFDNGHSTEGRWQRYLLQAGLAQCKTDEDRAIEIPHVKIRGHLDNIVVNPLTKEKFVWEFKTINTDAFKELKQAQSDHIMQTHCYMFATGIFQCIIMYEDKNDQSVKQYQIKFNPEIWRSIETRLLNIIKLVEEKTLPWRTPIANDTKCQFYWTCSSFEFPEDKK